MLELVSGVSGKRDALPERQSSWLSALGHVRSRLLVPARTLQLSFGGFVLLHLSAQAYRAYSDGALPEAGFEQAPWLVGALCLLFWLPFSVLSLRKLTRSFVRSSAPAAPTMTGQERALAVVEPLALALVLLFGTVHGALMAWPLLGGSLTGADLRAELVAALSSTWRGLPAQGIAYLCAVGAASFCAGRLTLAALPAARPALARTVVGLAVLSYLLGSYAVIRCGSGSILP
jgi:hypothetical protein